MDGMPRGAKHHSMPLEGGGHKYKDLPEKFHRHFAQHVRRVCTNEMNEQAHILVGQPGGTYEWEVGMEPLALHSCARGSGRIHSSWLRIHYFCLPHHSGAPSIPSACRVLSPSRNTTPGTPPPGFARRRSLLQGVPHRCPRVQEPTRPTTLAAGFALKLFCVDLQIAQVNSFFFISAV